MRMFMCHFNFSVKKYLKEIGEIKTRGSIASARGLRPRTKMKIEKEIRKSKKDKKDEHRKHICRY